MNVMAKIIIIASSEFEQIEGPHKEILSQCEYDAAYVSDPSPTSDVLIAAFSNPDVVGTVCDGAEFTREVLETMRNRGIIISRNGIGVDKIDLEAAQEFSVSVVNTPGVAAAAVSEHAMWLLGSVLKNIPSQNKVVQERRWERKVGTQLHGKTVGIIGFGNIGRQFTARVAAFGVNIVVFDPFWHDSFTRSLGDIQRAARVLHGDHLDARHVKLIEEVVETADVISFHIPAIEDNVGIISERLISRCKPTAIIINTSRGTLANETDIADALCEGRLRAYATDVMVTEPVTSDMPLLGLEQVVLTPHISSFTQESTVAQLTVALQNIINIRNGGAPTNWVVKKH